MRPIQKRVATAPDPIKRPGLAHFLWERDLGFRDAAGPLGRSHEYVRRLCLPYGDPKRIVPTEEDLRRIAEFTGGAIGEAQFAPPGEATAAEVIRMGRAS